MLFVLIFNLFFIVIYFIYIVKLVLISIENFFFFRKKGNECFNFNSFSLDKE